MVLSKIFNPTKTLSNKKVLLRKLLADDFDALKTAMSDPKIWQNHPQHDRYKLPKIQSWFEDALQENALAIIDKDTSQLIGSSRYYEMDTQLNEVAIGYTFLITKHWGGETNLAMKRLMFQHAWQHFDTVWLHIAEENTRSRCAAEKIGAKLHHTGIKHDIAYCWYLLPKGSL